VLGAFVTVGKAAGTHVGMSREGNLVCAFMLSGEISEPSS